MFIEHLVERHYREPTSLSTNKQGTFHLDENIFLAYDNAALGSTRPHRLSVRTSGFHPGKGGSTPPGVTTKN